MGASFIPWIVFILVQKSTSIHPDFCVILAEGIFGLRRPHVTLAGPPPNRQSARLGLTMDEIALYNSGSPSYQSTRKYQVKATHLASDYEYVVVVAFMKKLPVCCGTCAPRPTLNHPAKLTVTNLALLYLLPSRTSLKMPEPRRHKPLNHVVALSLSIANASTRSTCTI